MRVSDDTITGIIITVVGCIIITGITVTTVTTAGNERAAIVTATR
jgi:hypothetical protein